MGRRRLNIKFNGNMPKYVLSLSLLRVIESSSCQRRVKQVIIAETLPCFVDFSSRFITSSTIACVGSHHCCE
jgi:hypothetical protein